MAGGGRRKRDEGGTGTKLNVWDLVEEDGGRGVWISG